MLDEAYRGLSVYRAERVRVRVRTSRYSLLTGLALLYVLVFIYLNIWLRLFL